MYTPALRWDNLQETHGPPPPSHPTLISATFAAACFIGVTTPALRWDNLPETHGPPPPSHPALISVVLCGSVFHRSVHPGASPGCTLTDYPVGAVLIGLNWQIGSGRVFL
ncbi:hypothetical protein [Oligosphaera ethanolica]|uniref:Uncharacterized protein n=1 Tax=Oligosphaera ethanolica TaxID=760260 RepID=A0AAE3VG45_9BACT|nr:hypothetical protein [Oligosphaera ethanolica]MDQ0289549.1 hypothetical protein [Oligosphaera ethanolica]